MSKNNCPIVLLQPIAKVSSLASLLSVNEAELTEITSKVDQLWKPGRNFFKQSGELRITHDAYEPLKTIHERIKNRLLKKGVQYPYYLLGAIASDAQNKRGCLANAHIHSKQKILITEDIKNFYPSTTIDLQKSIHKIY